MICLGQFTSFDIDRFLKGKSLVVTGCKPWKDSNTDETVGTRVTVAIVVDKTEYVLKDGQNGSNRFEKFAIKVRKVISIPENTYVMPVNGVGSVYGDYRNNLSVTADDIKILQPAKQ